MARLSAGRPRTSTISSTPATLPATIAADATMSTLKKASSILRRSIYASLRWIRLSTRAVKMLNASTTASRMNAASMSAESYSGMLIISP